MGREGRGRGAGLATAIVVVCAVGVLMVPGAAHAAPGRPEPTPQPTETAGRQVDLETVHRTVDRLYRQAEVATDAYNLARSRQAGQERSIEVIAQAVVAANEEMAELRKQAGAMARAQYRHGGMPPEARLLLSDDPEEFLRGVSLVRRGQQATRGVIGQLATTQDTLDRHARNAALQWQALDRSRAQKEAAHKQVKKKLAQAKKLESRLEKDELERLRKLEEEKARAAQTRWLDSGILDDLDSEASPAGRRAVEFATAQIGKDYVWGAEGPDTYDCSGLTLKAWAAGGRAIPRTSQEQWKRLPKVEIQQMRPGDLIIYFKDASHVAMYIGDGVMVHAPRPGRQITTAVAGSMPILGVVRPDK